jgi:Ubiquitin-activating enzyme E1 FCCH domain
MTTKLVVGPIDKGLKTNRLPFNIDNDSFPTLINAYQWRGRVKRKRGTSILNRLQRFFNSAVASYGSITSFNLVSGQGNLLTAFSLLPNGNATMQNGNIIPGSVTFTDSNTGDIYTDPGMNGNLLGTPAGSGTIDYASGVITIVGGASDTINTVTFRYYPKLPVMGLETLTIVPTQFPGELAFDTTYSYNIQTGTPYEIYDVSFYKNPAADATNLPGYIPKTPPTQNWSPTNWNGFDYQQFWTVNYQGALWATNGIDVNPYTGINISMQFRPILTVTVIAGGPPATATLQITAHKLVVGDFVFVNEVLTTTGINLQTGYVITVTDANNVIVEFPFATIATNGTKGIAQYLTSQLAVPGKDCLRWYDGDPTSGNVTTPAFVKGKGWVNFAPPLTLNANSIVISDLPNNVIYYLVGARMIFPFKDRLLFIGPVIQSSATGPFYLQDTVIYSQNGTPYYTASFTYDSATPADPTPADIVFHPILTPVNQTASAAAYLEDQTGFGGFVTAAIDQPLLTTSPNEDTLIMGFQGLQTRFVYTGNDIVPFNFFIINSELGSQSTFSAITMDQGVISRGNRGYILTSQTQCQRIDLDIPDQVFEIDLIENGNERFCAQRDFINEWIYFSYPANNISWRFPSNTLQYNYRDDSWALFVENYTTYGTFQAQTGDTWNTIGNTYPTWSDWNVPWNAGSTTLLQPKVIAGNQQGFVMFRDQGTGEGTSLSINNFSFTVNITGITNANPAVITAVNQFVVGQQIMITGVVGMTQVNGNTYIITAITPTTITIDVDSTAFGVYVSGGIAIPLEPVYSPDHCLNSGDYIIISGALGTISTQVNGKIFKIFNPTLNGFSLDPSISPGTYFGGAVIQRMYIPLIQTKQFPMAWGDGRKTRIGPQMYLLSTTDDAQITLQIYLSQNENNPYNIGPIVPDPASTNNSLIYSTVLYTCPESTNLGLTPANTNLQMPTAIAQDQIWHRVNTSLIGDTVQLGFTLSAEQMITVDEVSGAPISQFAEIELHGFIAEVSPSYLLA